MVEDFNRAHEISERAISLMDEHAVPASPQNYEIWYTFVTGRNPELKATIEALIKSGRPFTHETSDTLYDKHFSRGQTSRQVMDVGDRMQGQLQSLMSMLTKAGEEQKNYGTTLEGVSTQLGGDLDRSAVQEIVKELARETREMASRAGELEEKLADSTNEIQELRQTLETIRNQSLTDQLTGIANRRCFDERLNIATEEAKENGEPLCLLLGDIDHFKKFNDTYGHQTGDQVLKLVASCVRENVKGKDTAARYGGEEFAVILPSTALKDAVTVSEHIRETVQSKRIVKRSTGESLGAITLSLGVAFYVPGEPISEFIARADACLYAAKRAGRNRSVAEDSAEAAKDALAKKSA